MLIRLAKLNKDEKRAVKTVIIAFCAFILINIAHHTNLIRYPIDNYLFFHTILGFFGVFVSFSIFTHGWNTFYRYPSNQRIIISLVFLQVGIYDLSHVLLYQEMPFFQNEHTVIQATTFWIMARATDSLGLRYAFKIKDANRTPKINKNEILLISIIITFTITAFIIFSPQLIPVYITEHGLAPLKNLFEIIICIFYTMTLIAVIKKYRESNNSDLLTVFIGITFLLLGELVFISCGNAYKWDNLFGHLYNVVGFFYLMKGIYFPQVTMIIRDRDLAEQKWLQAEQQIKENKDKLMVEIIKAQEEERHRVARDLHDGIGQKFYSIVVKTNVFRYLTKEADMFESIASIRDIADEGMTEVKEIATELRPSALDDLGLVPAIRSHSKQFEQIHNIKINLISDNISEYTTPEIDLVLYRIYQEALSNIVKHAAASKVIVKLVVTPAEIIMSVIDDGQGFDLKSRAKTGIGLLSMQERSELVGGKLTVLTKINEGTIIKVTIPINNK